MALRISCKAVLFDMDGTLVDSTESVEMIWGRWAARHNLNIEHILSVSHGRRTMDTLRDVAPHLDIEEEARRLEAEEIDGREGVREVPGAAALLARLPPDRWCVVTSASRPLAEVRLTAAGLPIPPVLICSSDVLQGKPDPEGYLKGAARLGVAPADCLVLEDTPAGLAAGRAAGSQVLALTTTFGCHALPGATCIANFRDLNVSESENALHFWI